MASVSLASVSKVFSNGDGRIRAVDDLNLEVPDQKFVVLVGPSGCGKSTTLRMIAGLESVSSGSIHIGDRDVSGLAPKDRDIAMVFQNYALYPHMTAYKNMAFGLKMRRTPKAEIDRRVREVAALLGLERLLDRKPAALSGGECQRVAVGRAIMRDPKVFLFDEPLSNLDAKLRVQMRTEIKTLQRKLRATMIYVTHDQEEAMTLGDTLVILNDGRLQQQGTPLDVYRKPANRFVAEFIGTPTINILEGRLQEANGGLTLAGRDFQFTIPTSMRAVLDTHSGAYAAVGIRPEYCEMVAPGHRDTKSSASTNLPCRIDMLEPLGDSMLVYVTGPGDVSLVARTNPGADHAAGDHVILRFDPTLAHFFANSGRGERLK